MEHHELAGSLRAIILPLLEQEGLELVDLSARREGRDLFFRILADRPEAGITLDECARLNRQISLLLEEKDIFPEGYILEVSSPGLDRPLLAKADFLRCKNKKVKFFLNELIAGKLEWDGVINKIEGDLVFIDTGTDILEIPLGKINKGKQLLDIPPQKIY